MKKIETLKDKIVLWFVKWMMKNRYSIFLDNELAFGCLENVNEGQICGYSDTGDFKEIRFWRISKDYRNEKKEVAK